MRHSLANIKSSRLQERLFVSGASSVKKISRMKLVLPRVSFLADTRILSTFYDTTGFRIRSIAGITSTGNCVRLVWKFTFPCIIGPIILCSHPLSDPQSTLKIGPFYVNLVVHLLRDSSTCGPLDPTSPLDFNIYTPRNVYTGT